MLGENRASSVSEWVRERRTCEGVSAAYQLSDGLLPSNIHSMLVTTGVHQLSIK